MGTNVTYNGVMIKNCVTRQWDETVAYDSSGTDSIGTEFNLTFEGTLHLQDPANASTSIGIGADGGPGGNASAAALYDEVTRRLHVPRRDLEVEMNGDSVISIGAPSNARTSEFDNGPKPLSVTLTHISGNALYRVRFSIKARIVDCENARYLPWVINNRWSVGESMDSSFFITRTISGSMRLIRSKISKFDDNSASGAFANKYLTIPGLERGFRRESIQYQTDATGLNVNYTVVDRQIHQASPSEAATMTGSHRETTNDGITTISSVSVTLNGRPNSNKLKMLQQAIDVMDSRLRIVKQSQASSKERDYIPLNYAIVDNFGERCSISIDVTVKRVGKNPHMEMAEIITNRWGQPIAVASQADYDPTRSPIPEIHGYNSGGRSKRDPAVAMLLECYLQSVCDTNIQNHAIPSGKKPGKKKKKADDPTKDYPQPDVIEYTPAGDLSTTDNTLYSEEHRTTAYSTASLSSRYVTDAGRIQMPIARYSSQRGNDASVIARAYMPQTQRIVVADFERANKEPELPEPLDHYRDGTLEGYLLETDLEILSPVPAADGITLLKRIRIKYVYAMNRAPTNSDRLRVGVVPFMKGNATDDDNKIKVGDLWDRRLGV